MQSLHLFRYKLWHYGQVETKVTSTGISKILSFERINSNIFASFQTINKQTNKQTTNKEEHKHAIALNYILLFLLSYPVAHKGWCDFCSIKQLGVFVLSTRPDSDALWDFSQAAPQSLGEDNTKSTWPLSHSVSPPSFKSIGHCYNCFMVLLSLFLKLFSETICSQQNV